MRLTNTRGLSYLSLQKSLFPARVQLALFTSPMPDSMDSISFDYSDSEAIAYNADLLFSCVATLDESKATVEFKNIDQESSGVFQKITSGLLRFRKLIDKDLIYLGELPNQDAWLAPHSLLNKHGEKTTNTETNMFKWQTLQNSYFIDTPAKSQFNSIANYGLNYEAMAYIDFPEKINIDALHFIAYDSSATTDSFELRIDIFDEISGEWLFYKGPLDRDGQEEEGISMHLIKDTGYCTKLEEASIAKRFHVDLSSSPISAKRIRVGSPNQYAYILGMQFLTKTLPKSRLEQSAVIQWGLVLDRNSDSPNFGGTSFVFDVGGLNSDTMMQLIDTSMVFTSISDKYAHSEYPIIDYFKVSINSYPNEDLV
jgi:hypothetical protein